MWMRPFQRKPVLSAVRSAAQKLGLAIRQWVCSNCEAVHDRDQNAALNIARLGCDIKGIRKLRRLGRGGITDGQLVLTPIRTPTRATVNHAQPRAIRGKLSHPDGSMESRYVDVDQDEVRHRSGKVHSYTALRFVLIYGIAVLANLRSMAAPHLYCAVSLCFPAIYTWELPRGSGPKQPSRLRAANENSRRRLAPVQVSGLRLCVSWFLRASRINGRGPLP